MIPTCFTDYRSTLAVLNEVTEWSLLRKWALSEVYRVRLATGESRIIKWGGSEMAGEAGIYRDLVYPLQIKAPRIFEFIQRPNSAVMVMEDAGEHNLEQRPLPQHFLEAAKVLARLRTSAAANLEASLPKKVIDAYSMTANGFLALLEDLLKSPKLAGSSTLANMMKILPPHLERLYQAVPVTIVHSDYHAKNLLVQADGGVVPIDWSITYLSPHLGDLYSLTTEAQAWCGLSRDAIVAAYREVSHVSAEQVNWQLLVGGLCWLIRSLRWLAYGGTEIIPGSDAWIPDLMNDAAGLCEELA
ncbi:phosphotransferase [Paenibacillus silvisoli]|uniref:phosphotransferase n=1 Tax=Paenibacillus silvisoli TaxID=3110539 RepID=UPI0028052957|nr:phosphotransferase [Paenibacillus silvisoli]